MKVSGTVARISIPRTQTGNVYWWATASRWDGPAPCGGGCVDFVPNNFPDLLHDMIPPVVNTVTTPLRVWQSSTTLPSPSRSRFPTRIPGSSHGPSNAARSGQDQVDDRCLGDRQRGRGGPDIVDGVEGTRMEYRVVAKDEQGNRRIGPTRRVYIPRDDDTLAPEGVFSATPTPASDGAPFGGGYSADG